MAEIFICFEYCCSISACTHTPHHQSHIASHIHLVVHLLLKHTCSNTPPSSSLCIFSCLAYTSVTTVTHSCIYSSCTLSNAHTQTHTNAHTRTNLKIHPERLLCGIQSQCSWLESLSTASDVTSARSVSCSPPPPFLFPILFHQLSPSFDTSEGVPHMPVTSPLLHQRFLPSSLSRACVSVWNLCTL